MSNFLEWPKKIVIKDQDLEIYKLLSSNQGSRCWNEKQYCSTFKNLGKAQSSKLSIIELFSWRPI